MWRIAPLMLALVGSCFAQTPPPKGRVEGRVTNQAGAPLNNATVALMGNNRTPAGALPPSYTAISNAMGEFVFEDIEPNTYRLIAQRTGYLELIFTQPNGTVVIPIAQGDRRNFELKMTAQSFLSGKITDVDGEPFPNASVAAFRVSRVNGNKQLTALSPVPAGADGNFSIGNLTAGRYYLAATNPPSLTQANLRKVRANNTIDERYVTTYYPSAVDTSTAVVIDVPPGAEIRNMDIRMRRAAVFHIYGKAVNASGEPVANGTVNLLYPGLRDPINGLHRIPIVEGAFQFNGLLPGTYTLQARSGTTPASLQTQQTLVISDRDIEDVVLSLAPGLEIPLSVRIEDADASQAQTIRKALGRFTLTSANGVNDNAMAQSKGDGTWLFRNIGSGSYLMGLRGPEGTYVKSIRFGNQDITKGWLDTTSGAGALELVLAPHAAEVTGVVQDANGQPLPGITVTLWTPGLPAPGTLDQAVSTRTDGMGSFRFASLRPGEYRIAAWEKIETGVGNISEFHVRFDGSATVVKLTEDSHETVRPVLISRDKVEAEAAKLP